MPKSDVELQELFKKTYESQFVVPSFVNFAVGYRLAESEKDSKYDKLVEGLRDLPKGEIRSNGKGGQLLMPPEYVLSYSAIESLITEIEGGSNDKAEGVRRGK